MLNIVTGRKSQGWKMEMERVLLLVYISSLRSKKEEIDAVHSLKTTANLFHL